ncbi:bifunctional diguanylate cyclase/phosphodiesterase [Spiribacter halobius]|uniref:bifunctional diguanylate cyclase/phosphodiesterase n=1 Tax=Sediminicurvatus halobius TaxID=2182432 RepID=UPI00130505CF|nr:diguanylate cyclase [Spiribacter halobius]UEX78568.1 diguanylate cyclase [Spiribacter halobius]
MSVLAPPTPANENARLQALHALDALETADEPVFNALTRLVARLLDVPTAFISLIDENRQWFRACVGFGEQSGPRELSFCGHAILDPARATVVPDASRDPRFRDNPYVARDGIRFYVGMPLVTEEGYALGTLCAVDATPHPAPDEETLARLADLARLTVEHLRVRLVTRRLRAMEAERGRGRDLIDVVYHAADMGFLMIDHEHRVVDLNPRAAEICGRGVEALMGIPALELAARHQASEVRATLDRVFARGDRHSDVWLLHRDDGRVLPAQVVNELIELDDGERFVLATLSDLTDEQRRSRLTEDRARIMELVLRHAPMTALLDQVGITLCHQHPEALVVVVRSSGATHSLEYASEREEDIAALLPRLPLDPRQRPCHDSLRLNGVMVHPDLYADDCEAASREAARHLGVRSAWAFAIPGGNDETLGTLAVFHRDVQRTEPGDLEALREVGGLAALAMERRRLLDELSHRANTDALTGLPNRSLLQQRVGQALHALPEGETAALLLIDLDNFKLVNDALGHDAGDELLVQVAESLQRAVRPADTVARLGGDEFVVLLPRGGREAAARVAEKLRQAVTREVALQQEWTQVSPSIGIAMAPEHGEHFGDLLRAADAAMYSVKASGRNGHAFHDEQIRDAVQEAFRLSRDIRGGELASQLVVAGEARVNSAGELLAAQLGVRWLDPEHGLRDTAELLNQASRNGALEAVESFGLAALAECSAALARSAPTARPVYVITRGRIWDERFRERLVADLQCLPCPPELQLSLPGKANRDGIALLDAVARLREAIPGLRLSLGGLGGDQPSLGLVQALEPDAIVIDGSLFAELDADDAGRREAAHALLQPLVALGRALAPEIVADGIARPGQWAAAQQIGCDTGQGPLFADRLPEALRALLHLHDDPA